MVNQAQAELDQLAGEVMAAGGGQKVVLNGIGYTLYELAEDQSEILSQEAGWVGTGLGARLWWWATLGGQDYLAEETGPA